MIANQRHRVLVVEDNPGDSHLAMMALSENTLFPCEVLQATRLSEAMETLKQTSVDAVLLDLGLPDSRGLETLQRLRKDAPQFPVIVITGRNDDETLLAAIEQGATGFLVKGEWSKRELMRSIGFAILRPKSDSDPISTGIYKAGGLEIDLIHHRIRYAEDGSGQVEIELTPVEFRLLTFLICHEDDVQPRERILKHLSDPNSEPLTVRNVDAHVSALRRKSSRLRQSIRSVYGVGYCYRSAGA